jgi:hypothetical protein
MSDNIQIIGTDDPFGSIETTALGINWGIRRCNIKGCSEKILRVIVTGSPAGRPFGMCEKHWVEASSTPGGKHIELDFTPLDGDQ